MTRYRLALVAAALGFACQNDTGTKDTDSGTVPTDTDTDTGTTETGTDTSTTPITYTTTACTASFDPAAGASAGATEAMVCRVGNGVVAKGAYTGVDEIWVLPLVGNYTVEGPLAVCKIRYTLTSTVVRDDCTWGTMDCDWAFDLVSSDAAIDDPMGVCLAAVGIDAANLATLNGVVESRGYHPDYAGHAKVRMEVREGEWRAAGNADYEEVTGAFSYADSDGDRVPL